MSIFVSGPVDLSLVGRVVQLFNQDPRVGGQNVFVGQVRADEHEEGTVRAIEFTAHEEMANAAVQNFLQRIVGHAQIDTPDTEHPTIDSFSGGKSLTGTGEAALLPRVFLRHGLGEIPVGGAPIIIVVGAERREQAFRACRDILEALKSEAPIFGKELLEAGRHRWKENS